MKVYLCFLFIFVNSLSIWAVNKERGEHCVTPDNEFGVCMILNYCQRVYDAITSKNKSNLEFAKKSYCGYDVETLVCCEHPGPVVVDDSRSISLPSNDVCGVVKEENRIFGGKLTSIGEFPWMVALEYKKKSNSRDAGIKCGGSLINNEFVLTAAQCVLHPNLQVTAVHLGEWNITTDPDCQEYVANDLCADPVLKIKAKEIISHPLYNSKNKYNDIALIRLEKKIQFTDYIKPICLSSPLLTPPNSGTVMTSTGWGLTEEAKYSEVLLKVKLPIVSKDICSSTIGRYQRPIGLHQLCAGGELGKDVCVGDIGAPLMRIYEDKENHKMNWYQDGIVSWGALGCANKGYPSVYTKIADYFEWITNIITD
ncbi:hypothetical protein ILUMI_09875 [Ignelater luminosus]|uniref:CLIP domain-containing serine protease n=1 Tax=Ignelater luminosus TaxID=2038154 RepID=A0A8K0D3F8_IGNLU|nr:hypothetical protein ILUMI_09875 [Ignelater luminosus]